MKFITRCLLYSAIGILFTCFFGVALESMTFNNIEYVTQESNTEMIWTTESSENSVTVEDNSNSTVGEPTEEMTEEPTEDITEIVDTEIVDSEVTEITYYCEWGDVSFTQEEFELILTTVFCEIGGETKTEQHAVACAILNQIVSGKFGSTVHKVIYRKNNFAVTQWPDFENRGWTKEVEQSVLLALTYNPYPRDMFYFRTGHFHRWAVDYKNIGKLYFSTDK